MPFAFSPGSPRLSVIPSFLTRLWTAPRLRFRRSAITAAPRPSSTRRRSRALRRPTRTWNERAFRHFLFAFRPTLQGDQRIGNAFAGARAARGSVRAAARYFDSRAPERAWAPLPGGGQRATSRPRTNPGWLPKLSKSGNVPSRATSANHAVDNAKEQCQGSRQRSKVREVRIQDALFLHRARTGAARLRASHL